MDVDVVFLDANHDYGSVLRDIDNALRVRRARWILLDDYGLASGVRRASREFERLGKIACRWPLGVPADVGCDMENESADALDNYQGRWWGSEGMACLILAQQGDDAAAQASRLAALSPAERGETSRYRMPEAARAIFPSMSTSA